MDKRIVRILVLVHLPKPILRRQYRLSGLNRHQYLAVLLAYRILPHAIPRLVIRAVQRNLLPHAVQCVLGKLHVLKVLMRVRPLYHRVIDTALPRQLVQRLDRRLHTLHRQEGGQIGGERGQHQHDKQPVRGHHGAAGQRFGRLTTALRRERGERKPKGLSEREFATRIRIGRLVVARAVWRVLVEQPNHDGRREQSADDAQPHLKPKYSHKFEERSLAHWVANRCSQRIGYCYVFMNLKLSLPIRIPVCSKYGGIKSITSSRSAVIFNAATAMSVSFKGNKYI